MKFLPDLDPNSEGYNYLRILETIEKDEELTLEEMLFVLKAASWGANLLFEAVDCLTTGRELDPDCKAMITVAIKQQMGLCYAAAMEELRDKL